MTTLFSLQCCNWNVPVQKSQWCTWAQYYVSGVEDNLLKQRQYVSGEYYFFLYTILINYCSHIISTHCFRLGATNSHVNCLWGLNSHKVNKEGLLTGLNKVLQWIRHIDASAHLYGFVDWCVSLKSFGNHTLSLHPLPLSLLLSLPFFQTAHIHRTNKVSQVILC